MSGYVNLPPGGPADGYRRPIAGVARSPPDRPEPAILPTRLPRAGRGRLKSAVSRDLDPMPRNPVPAAPSYEQALAELERLVQAMEAGQLPLDQLLAGYRRGAELLQLCRERLQAVEEQVKLLDEGQLKPRTAS